MEAGMTALAAARKAERVTTSISLVVGPLLMTIGDLLHPEERMSPAEQIAIVVDHASRWYAAHLLLFLGILLFIPGFLGVTALTAVLKPVVGYAARVLIMIGAAGFASISLWTNLFIGPVVAAVGPAVWRFLSAQSCQRFRSCAARNDYDGPWR
jgi:hypothetical protein